MSNSIWSLTVETEIFRIDLIKNSKYSITDLKFATTGKITFAQLYETSPHSKVPYSDSLRNNYHNVSCIRDLFALTDLLLATMGVVDFTAN